MPNVNRSRGLQSTTFSSSTFALVIVFPASFAFVFGSHFISFKGEWKEVLDEGVVFDVVP